MPQECVYVSPPSPLFPSFGHRLSDNELIKLDRGKVLIEGNEMKGREEPIDSIMGKQICVIVCILS